MSNLKNSNPVFDPLKAFALCMKIWNHPDVLRRFMEKKQEDVDLELDDETTEKSGRKRKKRNESSSSSTDATVATISVSTPPLLPSLPTVASNAGSCATNEETERDTPCILGSQPSGDPGVSSAKQSSLDWAKEIFQG